MIPLAIHLRGLQKSYGRTPVLHGIDLEVPAGQVVGYIGPNGAGKSTTVRILVGLDHRFEGSVQIHGIDLREDPQAVKRIVGYVPEQAELYDVLTPREFFLLIGRLHGMSDVQTQERASRLLAFFDLHAQMDQRMTTFSKGMRQKVLIISGLLHNPQVLFFDEPLAGLDANSVILVKEMLAQLARSGKTIFYCSHLMDVVEKVSDRIVLIDQGRVVADGTMDDLRRRSQGSLEQIFAQLTKGQSGQQGPGNFMEMLEGS